MTIHKPFVVAINVSHDVRVRIHHAEQVAGNVAVQIMRKNQLPVGIVHSRAVGGDHVRLDFKIIADLPYIDMMTTSGKDKMDAACGQQLQSLFGIRGQRMVGESSVPSKSDATT